MSHPMEEGSSRKRPFPEEVLETSKAPTQKKVKFPKGKKLEKQAIESVPAAVRNSGRDGNGVAEKQQKLDLSDPRVAAKERARRRAQMREKQIADYDENSGNIAAAEVRYQDNDVLEDDGIQFEPFNLDQEREEGYFDESGNFVEYVADKEEKDAWLDSLQVNPQLAQRASKGKGKAQEVVEEKELTSDDIGQMKRRIADALEPDETVLQALRRLKGTSNKKEKMSEETKLIFDQLTEDTMKLMDNGEYDVYHEKKDVFEREAEGYESLVRARQNILSTSDFDMFGDADENASADPSSGQNNTAPVDDDSGNKSTNGAWSGTDYVFDESSRYYYSSSLGYYYDPSTQLYCCATTGKWYSYNEETSTYDEVQPVQQETTASTS